VIKSLASGQKAAPIVNECQVGILDLHKIFVENQLRLLATIAIKDEVIKAISSAPALQSRPTDFTHQGREHG